MMTEDEMVDAIVGKDDEAVLVGWILTAKYAMPDEATQIAHTTSDTMDLVTHLGLAESTRHSAQRRLHGDPSDE